MSIIHTLEPTGQVSLRPETRSMKHFLVSTWGFSGYYMVKENALWGMRIVPNCECYFDSSVYLY